MIIGFDARFMSVPGGLGRYAAELLRELVTQNPTDFFVVIVKKNPDVFATHTNIRWVETNIHWYGYDEQIRLGRLMNTQTDVQLWHIPHWNVPITLRKPFVMTFHDFIFEEFPTYGKSLSSFLNYKIKWAIWRILLAINLRRARKIITISNFVREQILRREPSVENKIEVIYNGLTHLPPASAPTFSVQKPFFLMVGNSYPHKNHAIVLKLLKKYRAEISEHFYLLTHRDRFSEALEKTISDAGLSDRIHIVFDASDSTLAWMYENCEALIFPSLSEGFGIPPLEALFFKKPVIAAKTSSLPEILESSATWFEPTNEDSLFDALLKSKNQKNNGESVLHKYSWDAAAKSTRILYQSVL